MQCLDRNTASGSFHLQYVYPGNLHLMQFSSELWENYKFKYSSIFGLALYDGVQFCLCIVESLNI